MPNYLAPWQRECDCHCPVHHRQMRLTYDNPRCACTIICATQPLTLIIDRWACALFLNQDGELRHVPVRPDGAWDWANTAEIDSRSEFYDAGVITEHLLRTLTHVLTTTGY
jgi:hypothetical protein